MNRPAPIVFFVYKRLWHTRQAVEALQKNELAHDSDLVVYCDGPRKEEDVVPVQEVRDYIREISGFRTIAVKEMKDNLGLARSIISGVTEVVERRGKVIVLEDDHVSSPHFLTFMNQTLCLYEDCDCVAAVHGYFPPIRSELPESFLLRFVDCWGWGTWRRSWRLFEKEGSKLLKQLRTERLERLFNFGGSYDYVGMLEGQINGSLDSWAIRWYASAFLQEKLGVFPSRNLIQHIGWDEGTHFSDQENSMKSPLADSPICVEMCELREHNQARAELEAFFRTLKPGLFSRIREKLGALFGQDHHRLR